MATIPVYLTDDDGNEIEQTAGSGDFIIIGYVDQDLFANASGELYTTFFDVVQAATPEQKAEVLLGLRLAKGIRGDLRRFELSGSSENAYVKYNHSIFGGRYQSQYTALGAIAGTYLRRGGSAFTKELVEAALVSGPFANFTNSFPSLVLPGDVQLSVSAGGGTVEGYAWTITDGTTTFSPTVASPTVTVTAGTWTASVVVTIDGADYTVGPQSFDAAVFSASTMSPDVSTPALGQLVTISLDSPSNPSLIDTTEWSFGSAPNTEYYLTTDPNTLESRDRVEIPIVENVDYEVVSSSSTEIRVRFLTGGEYHVNAVVKYADGSVAAALSDVDIAPSDNIGTLTDNHSLSLATADALYSGDAHVIILGDSLMNIFSGARLARGLREEWRPARWAGLQHVRDDVSNNVSGLSHLGGAGVTQVSSDNINRDGTNRDGDLIASPEFAAARYTPAQAHNGEFTITAETVSATSSPLYLTTRNSSLNYVAGRLQGKDDTFDKTAGLRTDMMFVGVDTGVTLDIDTPNGTTTSPSSITLTSGEIARASTTWDPTPSFLNEAGLRLSWDSQTIGEKFGVIDGYTYNPNVSGLSVSYMGDGGWDIGNHAGPYALDSDGNPGTSTHANSDEWYDDTSIEEHLKMVAYKDYAQTTLRDKIVVLFENQNSTVMGYQNAVRSSLLAVRSRWENAANAVDPSGQLFSRIQFVWMTLPEIKWSESHAAFAAQAREFMGQGGYSWLEIVDLNQQLREYAPGDGLDYSIPQTYTDVYLPNGGALIREADLPDGSEWYAGGDMVHPDLPGSLVMMSEFWKIVEVAASPATPISGGTISASATDVLTTDSVTFSLTGLVAEADRAVVWCDQNGTEIGRGEALTTTLLSSVTRVDAKVSTASGSETTITGPAMTVSVPNQAPVIFEALAVQGSNPVEGQIFNLTISAVDPDNDNLTYTLSSTAADIGSVTLPSLTQAVIPVTAGTAGVTVTYTVTVTDPDGVSDVSSLDVTPDAANTAPAISSGLAVDGSNPAEGDSFDLIVTATDADGDTLTYTLSSTAGDSDSVGPIAADTEARFTLTAGTAGAAVTYTVSIDDGTATPVTSQLTVTPSAALPPLVYYFNTSTATQGPDIQAPVPLMVGDTVEISMILNANVGAQGDNYQFDLYESVDGGARSLVQTETITDNGTFISNFLVPLETPSAYTTTSAGSVLYSVEVTHLPTGRRTGITDVLTGAVSLMDPANVNDFRLNNNVADKQVWSDAGLLTSSFVSNNNVFILGGTDNGAVDDDRQAITQFFKDNVTISATGANFFAAQFLWFGGGTGNYFQANLGGITAADRTAIADAFNNGDIQMSVVSSSGNQYDFDGNTWVNNNVYIDYDGVAGTSATSIYTRTTTGTQFTSRPSEFGTAAVHTLRLVKVN